MYGVMHIKMNSDHLFEKTKKEAYFFFIMAIIFTVIGYLYPYLGMGVIGTLMMTICFFTAKHRCQISAGSKPKEPKIIIYISGTMMAVFIFTVVKIVTGSLKSYAIKLF